MKFIITENQEKKLQKTIQDLIDTSLDSIRAQSEDWGLGEMDELDEIESINKVVIDRIVKFDKIKVYVDIHKNSHRDDFDNVRAEIQYMVDQWIPNVEIYINDIIDDRTFGPGIDW